MEELGEKEVKDIKCVFSRRVENFVEKHFEAPKHPVVDPESLLDKIFNFFSNSEKECDYSINVYRDMQALLAMRVSNADLRMSTLKYEGRVTNSVLVEKKNFDVNGQIKGLITGEKEPFGWAFSSEERKGEPYGHLRFNKLIGAENYTEESIKDNLTYDGLCAMLALAPKEFVLEMKNAIASEIQRNYELECSKIDVEENDSDHRINEVGEKYLELQACLCVLKERFEEEIALEQVSAKKYEEVKQQNIVRAATTDIAIRDELKDMNRFLERDSQLDSLPNLDDIKLDLFNENCGEGQEE